MSQPLGKRFKKLNFNSNRIESDIGFVVEKILKHRGKGKNIEYLIKWKNYSNSESSWEKPEDMACDESIKEYWEYFNQNKDQFVRKKISKRKLKTRCHHLLKENNWDPKVEIVEHINKDFYGKKKYELYTL